MQNISKYSKKKRKTGDAAAEGTRQENILAIKQLDKSEWLQEEDRAESHSSKVSLE